MALCADEKPQVQALDRSPPILAMMLGRRTRDYVRNGGPSLLATGEIARRYGAGVHGG